MRQSNKNGQLQWIGEAPPQEDARVIVTITERSPGRIEAAAPNGHRFVALAKQLAATGIADKFGDPIAWQREQRFS